MRRAALLVLALASPAAPAVGSAPPPTDETRFEALVREIGVLREDLDRLGRKERSLLNDMDRLQVEAAIRSREVAQLAIERRRTLGQLSESRTKLEAARRAIGAGEAALARQLREIYETGRLREVRAVLSLTEPVDAMRTMAYLDVLARRQSRLVEDLRRSRAEAEALEGALGLQARALADLEERSRQRARELERIRSRSEELLETTRKERDAGRSALAELTRAAEELERAIVAGPAGAAGDRPAPAPPDVGRLKGALEWPVPGTVKVPFGDVRHPKFGTVTPHPGIDIETEPGAPIRAVMGGRVVFSRRFSGYGNTVLLDHGGGYLSVYARAEMLEVAEGQEVVAGQRLGYSADGAMDGGPPTVYFEVRREGRAEDPAQWLKRRHAAGGEDVR